jgi:hypothetical protein
MSVDRPKPPFPKEKQKMRGLTTAMQPARTMGGPATRVPAL